MERINATLKIKPTNPISITVPNKMKFKELEQFLLSKFRIKLDEKLEIKNFINKDDRGLLEDIKKNDTIEIDMMKIFDLIFVQNRDDYFLPLVPFIPSELLKFGKNKDGVDRGSFGILLKCEYLLNKHEDREYAYKSFNIRNDNKTLQSFAKEVEAYSKLNHPAIPKFLGISYDVLHNHGILMEYISGEDLIKIIDSEKLEKSILINDDEKLQYIYQLADVISYLHCNNIIHRDLKPNNIMIKKKKKSEDKAQLFLIDYGLSKVDDGSINNTMASLVRNNKNVYKNFEGGNNCEEHPSFDIWALGCIIYYLYTKNHPCDNKENVLVNDYIRRQINFFKKEDFNDDFIYGLMQDCCAFNHEKRKTAEEIKEKVFLKIHSKKTNVVTQTKIITSSSSSGILKIQLDALTDKEGKEAIDLYYKLGEDHMRLRELDAAQDYFQKIIDIRGNKDSNLLAKTYLGIGKIQSVRNQKQKAKDMLLEAENRAKDDETSVEIYYHLGDIFLDLKELNKANEYSQKSLDSKIKSSKFGNRHFSTAASYCQLGRIQRSINDFSKSIDYLEIAKEIYLDIYKDNYPQICNINIELGKTYNAMSNYYKAIEHFNLGKSKLIMFKNNGSELANIYSLLGSVYISLQNYDQAEINFNKALEIYLRVKGEKDISVASCYNNIGLVQTNKKKYEDADQNLKSALKIFEEQPIKDYNNIANCLMTIAIKDAKEGNTELCKENLEKAQKIRENDLKETDTVELSDIYFNQGSIILCIESTQVNAKSKFEKSFNIRKKIFKGENHFDIASIYIVYGQMSLDKNDKDDAKNQFEKADKIYLELYGKTSSVYANFSHEIGRKFSDKNINQDAINYLLSAIKSREDLIGLNKKKINEMSDEEKEELKSNNIKLASSHFILAENFLKVSKIDTAESACEKARLIYSQYLGDKDTLTTDCVALMQKLKPTNK